MEDARNPYALKLEDAVTVRIAPSVALELEHKLGVVADEPELRESYGASPADVDALERGVVCDGSSFMLTIPAHLRRLVGGELEDAAKIAREYDARLAGRLLKVAREVYPASVAAEVSRAIADEIGVEATRLPESAR